jgi:BirA family biotin operon repressor/biotin-[acetyl-CoA-carboxylase] ligase
MSHIAKRSALEYVDKIMLDPDLPTMRVEELYQGWRPVRIGRRLEILRETASTNTHALDACLKDDADGLVVLADYQTSGRGRHGRSWQSPRGASILCSAVLVSDLSEPGIDSMMPTALAGSDIQPAAPATQTGAIIDRFIGWLTLAAAVAVCDAVREAAAMTPAVKWPNDIRVGQKKLGGILIESRSLGRNRRAWAVGIGLNCLQHAGHFPQDLRDTATSLDIETKHPIDRTAVARTLLQKLDLWLQATTTSDAHAMAEACEQVHQAWMSYAEPLGQRIAVVSNGERFEGQTLHVDPVGGLTIQDDTGRKLWFDPVETTCL